MARYRGDDRWRGWTGGWPSVAGQTYGSTETPAINAPSHPRRRLGVRQGRVREPRSLTDARARVERSPAHEAGPDTGRARGAALGVPLALLASDALALLAESGIVGFGTLVSLLFAVLVLAARATVRQYRPRLHLSVLDDVPRGLGSTFAGVGLTLAVTLGVWGGKALRENELLWRAGVFLALSLLLEALTLGIARRVRRQRDVGRRTLVIGAGRVGTTLGATLLAHPEFGLTPVGFTDADALTAHADLPLPLLSTNPADLPRTILEHKIDTTVLAFSGAREAQVVDTVIAAHQMGCTVLIVPRMFELHHDAPDVERIRGIPLLRLRPDPTLRPSWWVKRAGDGLVAVVGLLLLAVPLAVIAALIVLDSGRPVLFWQERVGLDGRPFRLCKFRSLRPRSEAESQTTWSIANDPRVSKVGKVLRRTSLDEVPQLWNILRGQMSLVGPRPERPSFVQQFSSEHERYWARHRVPVGLTGLAQVNGLRGDTSIRERARYDNYYIANWSLWLDVKIVLLTAREVLGGRGR